MKTKILLLFVFVSAIASANTNTEITSETKFKSRLDGLVDQIANLSDKIKTTENSDSIKVYAKQLMYLSEEMESTINHYYNYEGIQTSYALLLTNPPAYGVIINFPSNEPDENASAHLIWDGASNIRYFCSKNPEKIIKNLAKIDKAVEELKAI